MPLRPTVDGQATRFRQEGGHKARHRNDGYAVFGKVSDGMDVVDKIVAAKTSIQKGFRDVPETPVIIKSMKVLP